MRLISAAIFTTLIATTLFAHPTAPYDRSLFPHWLDTDNDCQNTRMEVLQRQALCTKSTNPPQCDIQLDEANCKVTGGTWICPYTGTTLTTPSALHIDHIIPLAHAWDHGASEWDPKTRSAFANDYDNLIAVAASSNLSKKDRAPHVWMPPNTAYHCTYLERWLSLKQKYHLTLSAPEAIFIATQLRRCE